MEPVPHADMAVADVHTADDPDDPDDPDEPDDHGDDDDGDNHDVVVAAPAA